ncbi:protein transport protein SEC16B homolog [Actinidia eriantha]|uniref:protein transport protein SEC16B homolog n=1 Tax=Actinidia eriantha TaxID=165200 RepID=UPI00258B23B9|nr:protein transport protein SEC16B homolog [Actinidia eriantha]
MTSPQLEVEDQTDVDFFDKLVDEDDNDVFESSPSFMENKGSDEVKEFSNLGIGEDDAVKVDSGGNVDSGVNNERESDGQHDNLAAEGNVSVTPDDVVQSNHVALEAKDELDSEKDNDGVKSGVNVKEVGWSSFNSGSHLRSGSGTGSYSDFFNELGGSSGDLYRKDVGDYRVASSNKVSVPEDMSAGLSSFTSLQHEGGQYHGSQMEQPIHGHNFDSNQYWESLYPGWRYDPSTGQWHQLEAYDATVNTQGNSDNRIGSAGDSIVTQQRSDAYCYQQTAYSVSGSVSDCTKAYVTNWNQGPEQNVEYPAHMVFDPQYPGWYYDAIAQEWQLLEPYTEAMNQPISVHHNQQSQDRVGSTDKILPEGNHSTCDNFHQMGKAESQGRSIQAKVSANDYNQPSRNAWHTASLPHTGVINISDIQESHNPYISTYHANNSTDQPNQKTWFKPSVTVTLPKQTSQNFGSANSISEPQTFVPAVNFSQHSNQMHFSPAYFESQRSPDVSQPLQSGTQFPYMSSEGRSSAGRPLHALVTFGFGGKLIVMKDNSSFTKSAHGGQDSAGGVISILNLMDAVMEKTDAAGIGSGACDYFYTLCQQSFPGPLVGGSVGSREVNKWIDETISKCESVDMVYRKAELLRFLFSLLKIACQCHGKLRSPFGTDQALKESDCPEPAVAKLFSSAKRNVSEYGDSSCCFWNLPSAGDIQATALEIQKLLISGRKEEALHCAKEGQLWGPALVLAAQLGDQLYGDTVKQMACHQLATGSALRTLCLLIAGQPADVFSTSTSTSSLPGAVNISQPSSEVGAICMLDKWEENLAIIMANRTKDDELVVIHLGDCLWKERGEVLAAHICYLVAEANFEPYSDSARICLIGADHWKFPRTYATPEAIQRTELYEYSKVLGNSQFILQPFQPYKVIYAHMLTEVGKVTDSLKYCQAILKCSKTNGSPEVEAWKQLVLSLEKRIKVHQQGGYSINLAPAKLVGKLLNLFDSTTQRVVGGLPPPVPSTSHGSAQCNEHDYQKVGPGVSNSQSTMAMSSLMPSASKEPISEWKGGSNRLMPNRSISEPDFGKSPRKVDSSKQGSSPDMQEKASGGSSRFGRFGSHIFQKTVGLVLRSRPDRQAKLGEKNKFYYDEKLKRWVEEGAETPSEEATLLPPPTSAAFQNKMPDYTPKDGPEIDNVHYNGEQEHKSPYSLEQNSGIPPIPPSSNHFAARGHMGVCARYVDTFNKGGATQVNLLQSPPLPAAKPVVSSNAKFFIPTPMDSGGEAVQTTGENLQESAVNNECPSAYVQNNSFPSPPTTTSSTLTMQRAPSMDNIVNRRTGVIGDGKSSLAPHSRRRASWSGTPNDTHDFSKMTELEPLQEVPGMPPSSFMPGDSSSMHFSMNVGSLGEDLHEVEL